MAQAGPLLLLVSGLLFAAPARTSPPDAGADGCSTPEAYVARVPGFHRMRRAAHRSEVLFARKALKELPLGGRRYRDQVAVAIECHFNDRQGWHHGASLFERNE